MDKEKVLKEIAESIKSCKKCRLYSTATNAVPGEGNINSKVIFIGEAPGHNEDISGRPFVGRAGKLLDISLKGIGYKREDIWIGNIIKHRPPDNREPLPDEISACSPFLDLQIKMINPVLIVTLGRYSMNYFYPEGKISLDKGRLVKIRNFYIYPVYHPAAALRSTKMLQDFNQDFQKIPEMLEKAQELLQKNNVGESSPNSTQDLDGQLSMGL